MIIMYKRVLKKSLFISISALFLFGILGKISAQTAPSTNKTVTGGLSKDTLGAPEPPKELTPQAKKAIRVDEGWDDQIEDHEEQAQQAVYPGQLRRIRRLTQEKLKARKFFDRAKMFM